MPQNPATSQRGAAVIKRSSAERSFSYDRKVMAGQGVAEHQALCALTMKMLDEAGGHELLNWIVAAGGGPARAREVYFGELGRINLAAVEWELR